jgi:hypothetical protein
MALDFGFGDIGIVFIKGVGIGMGFGDFLNFKFLRRS